MNDNSIDRPSNLVTLLREGAEIERLRAALEMLYDKWENGDPCYEDPETFSGGLGNAFKLTADEENAVLALIRRRPENCREPIPHETSGDAYTRRIERKVAAIVTWLEANQPDAFRRGLWDAVEKAGGGSSEETKAPHEHRWVLPAAPLSATNYFCGDCGFFPGPSIPQLDVPTCPVAGTAEHRFMLWLMKEIPPGTVISSPSWWSPRIFKAVQRAMEIQQERGEASRNEGSSEKASGDSK